MYKEVKGFIKDVGNMAYLADAASQYHSSRASEHDYDSREYCWHQYQTNQSRAVMYEFMAKGRETSIKNTYTEFNAIDAKKRKVARAEAELYRANSAEYWESAQKYRELWLAR